MSASRVLVALAAALAAGRASSQALPEQEWGAPWNGVGLGVRAIGMGGAFTAVSDDWDGMWWNPGALVRLRDTQVGFATSEAAWARPVRLSQATSALPFLNGLGIVTNAFRPWATGLAAIRNFHPESLIPWQDDYYQGTFVLPLNEARAAGLGVNVKFLFSDFHHDHPFVGSTETRNAVTGWAADVGLYYSIALPLRDRSREINFGAMARNLVGRSRVLNTERVLPSQIQLGAAYAFDDFVPRERSVLSLNYDQALRATLGRYDSQLRVGYEQWFFGETAALRMGYATPVPRYDAGVSGLAPRIRITDETGAVTELTYLHQGRPVWTGGMTVRLFGAQLNLAVTAPTESLKAEASPEVPETFRLVTRDQTTGEAFAKGVDKVRFHGSLTYHFGAPPASPYARIAVEPLVFAPKKGEVAVFTIDYRDLRGIERWKVEIKNSARVPVRTYSGKGAPPERLAWDGLDDRFNLAPDDDHTYTLTVRNRDGVETVTAPQSLQVFTPGERRIGGDPTRIRDLLAEQAKRDDAERARVRPLINRQMEERRAPLPGSPGPAGGSAEPERGDLPLPVLPGAGAPSTTVGAAPEPGATLAIGAGGGATPFMDFQGIEPAQIVRVQVPPAGTDGGTMSLDYETRQHVLRYLVREIRSLTEQSFAAVGPTVGSFMIQARYGNHLLVAETPLEVARGLREGRLDQASWIRASRFTLDGQEIRPEAR